MSNSLTGGAIKELADSGNYTKPVVQLLALKKLSANTCSGNGTTDRYRVLLSDGVHSNPAMLGVQLNKLVEDNALELFSVIQLDKFVCNPLPDNRRVMIVLEVSILQPGSQVGNKIGLPIPLHVAVARPVGALSPNPQQKGGSVVAQRPAGMHQSSDYRGDFWAHKIAASGNASKKSSLLQDMSQQLTCSICLDHYTVPKTVTPCLHTFCQQCLQETIDTTAKSSGATGKFPCPKCRGNVEFDCPDLPSKKNAAEKQFQTNFDIQSQLEMIKNKIASGCSKHEGEMLIFFCQSCDQLICVMCLGEMHRYCEFITVKEEAECLRAEFESERKELTDKEELLSQHKSNLAELEKTLRNATDMIECLDSCKAEIKDFISEVEQKKQTSIENIKGIQEYPDKSERLIQLMSGTDDLKLLLERETVSNLRQELKNTDCAPTTETLPSWDRLDKMFERLLYSVTDLHQQKAQEEVQEEEVQEEEAQEHKWVVELKKVSTVAASNKRPKGKQRNKKQRAKSLIIVEVRPWDVMVAGDFGIMTAARLDGIAWGDGKLVPMDNGMKKLQMECVVDDNKVNMEELERDLNAWVEYVHSDDPDAFSKLPK
ncbi:uncharacterized protein [Amphiura filiformis]|uniref:uncharacterized protein n=1 Tax=Amphiura filiformis TaxID=82378 RepID=UPI003B215E48